jgi:hypothetical protein
MKKMVMIVALFWSGAACALTPYQEGVRDWRNGTCYRARPYSPGPADKAAQWERG